MDVGEEVRALDSLPRERLEAELAEFAAHLSAAERRWLALVAEFDRRELFLEWGCRNCAAWLSWRCGLDPRSAREKVRVARALDDLPLVAAEFGKGTLSYSKVRALTRIATPENEEDLVGVALGATAAPEVRPDAPGIAARNRVLGINIDENTGIPKWYGDRLDLDHAITALLCLDRPGFARCEPHGLP